MNRPSTPPSETTMGRASPHILNLFLSACRFILLQVSGIGPLTHTLYAPWYFDLAGIFRLGNMLHGEKDSETHERRTAESNWRSVDCWLLLGLLVNVELLLFSGLTLFPTFVEVDESFGGRYETSTLCWATFEGGNFLGTGATLTLAVFVENVPIASAYIQLSCLLIQVVWFLWCAFDPAINVVMASLLIGLDYAILNSHLHHFYTLNGTKMTNQVFGGVAAGSKIVGQLLFAMLFNFQPKFFTTSMFFLGFTTFLVGGVFVPIFRTGLRGGLSKRKNSDDGSEVIVLRTMRGS